MRILINGEPIDFKLENEKNLRDLLESANKIFNNMDLYIISLKIDGKKYFITEIDPLVEKELSEINEIDFEVIFKQELVTESAENIIKYLNNVVNFIKDKNEFEDKDIKLIEEGLNWCISAFEKISNLYDIKADYLLVRDKNVLSLVIYKIKDMLESIYYLQLDNEFKKEFLKLILGFTEGIIKQISYVFINIKNIEKIKKLKHYKTLFEDNNYLIDYYYSSLNEILQKDLEDSIKLIAEKFSLFLNFIIFYMNVINLFVFDIDPLFKELEEKGYFAKDLVDEIKKIGSSEPIDANTYEKLSSIKLSDFDIEICDEIENLYILITEIKNFKNLSNYIKVFSGSLNDLKKFLEEGDLLSLNSLLIENVKPNIDNLKKYTKTSLCFINYVLKMLDKS